MARVYGIKKRLEKSGTSETLIKEIIGDGNLVNIITRMEKTLPLGQTLDILDSCACGGGKEYINQCIKTGKEIADKTLSEKVEHINRISPDTDTVTLNTDNTITATWALADGEKYKCLCSAAVKKGQIVADLASDAAAPKMPLIYCFCCAGSGRRHLQLQLGAKLKTKQIVSSPINSKGKFPCKIIFETV